MITLVTGSNGFIGSFLVERLIKQGHTVRCMVRKTSNLKWLKGLDVEYVYGELSDPASLELAVKEVDWVFHLAGVTKARDEAGYIKANTTGTRNLLNACRDHASIKKFVFVSSQAAGGPAVKGKARTEFDEPAPVSAYGRSKLLAEEAVLEYKDEFPVTIIRPPSVYGPRDVDVYQMFQQVNRGLLPVLGFGNGRASMVYIDDLLEGMLLAAQNPKADGKIFYISGDGEPTWKAIGRLLGHALGKKLVTLFVPTFVLDLLSLYGLAVTRITGKTPLLNPDKIREMKQKDWLCSNQRAKEELGYAPKIPLAEGFVRTAEWYKNEGWL